MPTASRSGAPWRRLAVLVGATLLGLVLGCATPRPAAPGAGPVAKAQAPRAPVSPVPAPTPAAPPAADAPAVARVLPFLGASEAELAGEWQACLKRALAPVAPACAAHLRAVLPGQPRPPCELACAQALSGVAAACNAAMARALDRLAWSRASEVLDACTHSDQPGACIRLENYVTWPSIAANASNTAFHACGAEVRDVHRTPKRLREARILVAAHRCRVGRHGDACNALRARLPEYGADPRAAHWRDTLARQSAALVARARRELAKLPCPRLDARKPVCLARERAVRRFLANFPEAGGRVAMIHWLANPVPVLHRTHMPRIMTP